MARKQAKLAKQEIPDREVWKVPHWDMADVGAIQALQSGTANAGQQQRALSYIVRTLCRTYDLPYRPDHARDTDFALGKMFVGQCIVAMINYNAAAFTQQEDEG